MHIFHDWIMSMTHDEVIHTCRICGKVKREPWYPIMGWFRPPQIPPPKLPETIKHYESGKSKGEIKSMNKLELNLGINLDMQEYYDNLVILNKSMQAQIKVLEAEPSICTHKKVENHNGVTICANRFCRKVIDTNGLYDYAK